MSENLKPSAELEELSVLLDEINAGRKPECNNPEINELLAVASFIKNADIPVGPPQHILDQIVDRAIESITINNRKSSKTWWYCGTLSTAVAIFLVAGLNLLPSRQKQVPVPPPISYHQGDNISKPHTEPSDSSSNTTSTTSNKLPAESTTPQNILPAAKAIPPIAEQAPPITPSKAERSRSAPDLVTAKSSSFIITPLTIPGKVPDLLITDKEKGILSQVYNKGTSQEITITQRLRSKNTSNIQVESKSMTKAKSIDINPSTVNMIRVTIADQEVTITGQKTHQELLTLAKSLK